MAEDDVPVADRVFGEGRFLRPQFIQPYKSKNVLIEGVTILNSPMWIVHPVRLLININTINNKKNCHSLQVLCENVIVRNINITRYERLLPLRCIKH